MSETHDRVPAGTRTTAPFAEVIAIHDPARPAARAAAVGRRLVSGGDVRLDVVTVPPAGDRGPLIVDRIAARDAVVVVDAHGGGFPGDVLFDEDAETALTRLAAPVLVVGPAAVVPARLDAVIVALDANVDAGPLAAAVTRWMATFGAREVVAVVLEAPSGWPTSRPADDGARWRAPFGDAAGTVRVEHVTASEPWEALDERAASEPGAVLAIGAPRWPGTSHWFSTARRLIRHATCPVLVVATDG